MRRLLLAKRIPWLALFASLASSDAKATEVFPALHSKNMPAVAENPVSAAMLTAMNIRYYITCWGPNNRSTSGPVHDQNCLKLSTWIQKDNVLMAPFQLIFPAMLMDPTRAKPAVANAACPNPALAGVPAGSVFELDFSNPQRMSVFAEVRTDIPTLGSTVTADGKREINKLRVSVQRVNLTQNGMQRLADGSWGLGTDGFASSNISIRRSENGNDTEVYVLFPGAIQAGQRAGKRNRSFCDAYYSPLMLFFDDKWPEFSGFSSFAVLPNSGWFVWPEAGSPGYFLALDRNKNGTIDSGEELFGENQGRGVANGFEALRKLDSDKNGLINAKDGEFHRLLLWNDANGNGTSEPTELVPLAKKSVVEISLQYKKNQVYPVGGGAELRENSTFVYRDQNGNFKKGEVYDVWLSPTKPPVRAAASLTE